jgi:hypothetical protein
VAERATRTFQEHVRLSDDGIVGPHTWQLLVVVTLPARTSSLRRRPGGECALVRAYQPMQIRVEPLTLLIIGGLDQ